MKKILITGKNSYIGGMFTEWVKQWPDKYTVEAISVRGDEWKAVDFSSYDTIFHVAGIVHKKETKDNIDLFYKVNRDLTFEIADKAKNDGVDQFIFMSTMNVYGVNTGIITENTPLKPKSTYGKSKLEAEKLIYELRDENFNVSIIRPPMVYGPNAVGNYSRLSKLSNITPVFPELDNKRSMIYIDNLAEFIRLIIDNNIFGIFCPQNKDYVNVSNLVYKISNANNKEIYLTKLFNPILKLFMNISVFQKIFGSLTYQKKISFFKVDDYNVINFEKSIYLSEKATD